MSRSNTDIINFISEGMTSTEIHAIIKLLDEKYQRKKQEEKAEQIRLFVSSIDNCMSAGGYVSLEQLRDYHYHKQTGYDRWKDKISWLNYKLGQTFRKDVDDINTWQAYILEYNKDSLKEYFARLRADAAERIIIDTKHRIAHIKDQLNHKAKRFDITKMNQIPDLVGKYCLSFLSTPETAEERIKNDAIQQALRWPEGQIDRPAKTWRFVMDSTWRKTFKTKYLPLILAKFNEVSFTKIKLFLERNSDRLIDLGCEKMSRSSKKLFLEHAKNFRPDKSIETLRYIDCVLRLK